MTCAVVNWRVHDCSGELTCSWLCWWSSWCWLLMCCWLYSGVDLLCRGATVLITVLVCRCADESVVWTRSCVGTFVPSSSKKSWKSWGLEFSNFWQRFFESYVGMNGYALYFDYTCCIWVDSFICVDEDKCIDVPLWSCLDVFCLDLLHVL